MEKSELKILTIMKSTHICRRISSRFECQEWKHLNEYDQAIYKAEMFGFNKIGIKYFEDDYLNKPYLFSYLKVID